MDSNEQALKNAIHYHNEFHRIAGPILEHVKQVSKQFIGKKINTLKGLASKYAEAIKFDRDNIEVKPLAGAKWAKLHHGYTHVSYSDLQIKLSVCFGDTKGTGCHYEERTFYFGKVENDILVSIDDNCKASTEVWDFQTELAAIKEFKRIEKLAEQAEDKINVGREIYKYF